MKQQDDDAGQNDDTAVLDEPVTDNADTEAPEAEEGEADPAVEPESEEVVVSIGDEAPAEPEDTRAPEWVRDLRKSNREKDRILREQQAEIARLRGANQPAAAVVVGAKPTLAEHDYDSDKYEAALEGWYDRKRAADAQDAAARKQQEQAQAAWNAKLQAYGTAKQALKVSDYADAEAAAQDVLSVVQQGVILNGADNPALLVYALGKSPAKAKELAAITDPVKFAFAVAKLESTLKVTPRKTAPAPERTLTSSVPGASHGAAALNKLRESAQKTGDYTAYLAAKRKSAGK